MTEISNFFPIYDLLHSQIQVTANKDNPLTDEEVHNLIVKINALDKLGRDMIYIFIRIHSLRYSDAKILDIPYGGEKMDIKAESSDIVCNAKFDLRNFPVILCRMLERFTDLHLRKLQEESVKSKVI